MSTTTQENALDAMLKQYEKNNSSTKNASAKTYDLKNYFNTFLKDGVKSGNKRVRILPTEDGSSPFVEMYGHKIQIDGEWKTFPCLKHEKDEACPFCEAREALLSTGRDQDKELAKKYNAKRMYVVKVIDRDAEHEGVKFWRFNHDYRKAGIFDKIFTVLQAVGKDITPVDTGRDLIISINRDQNNRPSVSGIAHTDPSPLSTDPELVKQWTSDTRTWEDVYSVRSYDYMAIVVRGGVPVWDKDAKKFVDKSTVKTPESDGLEAELTMGVENVKANVKAATAKVESETEEEGETDDLPF